MKKIAAGIFIALGLLVLGLAVGQGTSELKAYFNLSGQLNEVEGKELAITFSDDMVALGGSRRGETIVSLTPTLDGEFLWRGTKTLVFKPKTRFLYSTRYRIVIRAGIGSLNGHTVKKQVLGEFVTPLARIVGFQTASRDYFQYVQDEGSRFDWIWVNDAWLLRFNQPVTAAEVVRFLVITEKGFRSRVEFSARSRTGDVVELNFPGLLRRGREYQVRLARGFHGQEGNVGTLRDMSFAVITIPPFRLESPPGENQLPCDINPITLRFSNSLRPDKEPITNGWVDLQLSREKQARIPAYHLSAEGATLDIILDEPIFPGDLLTVHPASGISNDYGEKLGPVPAIRYRACSAAEPAISVGLGQPTPKVSFKSIAAADISLFKFKDELLFQLASRSDEYGGWESEPSFGFLEQVIAKQDLIERRSELSVNGVDSAAAVEKSIDLNAELGSTAGFFGVLTRRALPFNSCSFWSLYYFPVRQPFHLQVVLRRSFDFFIRTDLGRTLIWAYEKNSGLPVTAGPVTVGSERPLASVGATGPDGLLVWPSELKPEDWVVMRRGQQGSELAFSRIAGDTLERRRDLRLELLCDREYYKPGDELFIGGLLREFRDGRLLSAPSVPVRLRLLDPGGKVVLEKELSLDEWGGFKTSWISDVNGKHGRYVVEASAGGESRRLEVRIDFYQPNTFEVAIAPLAARYLRRQTMTAVISGDYLAGNPMAGDKLLYSLAASPAAGDLAAPAPNLSGFRFDLDEQLQKTDLPIRRQGKFDQAGKYRLSVPLTYFHSLNHAANLELSVTAQSAEGKEFSVSAAALFFPGNRICGIKAPYYADAGKEISTRLLLVDENGRPATGRVTLILYRRDWNSGRWVLKESGQPLSLQVPVDGMEHRFRVPGPGSYLLRADAADDSGSVTSSSASFYAWSYSWGDDQDGLELRSEAISGRIGQTLTCYLQSPGEGRALITVETDRVIDVWTVPLRKTTPLAIKIKKEYFPVFKVRVAAALANDRFEETEKEFRVLDDGHRLRVDISAPATVTPASRQQVRLRVADTQNRPRRAKVFVWAVDEGNLSLSGYRTPSWHDALHYRSPIDRTRSFRSAFNNSWNFQRPQLDIDLGEEGFFGRIMKPDGTPVAGATVSLKKKGGVLAGQATSSTAGYYFIPTDGNDDYVINAEKDDLLSLPAIPGRQDYFGELKSVDLVMVSREIAEQVTAWMAKAVLEGGIEGGVAGGVEGGLMESVALAAPAPAAAEKRMAAQKKDEELDKSSITVRSDFREVLFFTVAETKADGTASVEFKTSDQLSTYRLMAVAYAEEDFGSNQQRLLVTKDLLLTEAMPEFARGGDRFTAGVQVSNRTSQAQTVQILAEARGGIEISEPRHLRVDFAARSNQLVSFQFQAKEAAPAEVTFYASAADNKDGVLKKLVVTDNLVSESLLDFDSGKQLSKRIQPLAQAKQAKLKLTLAPTILRPAGHIAQKLIFYPYECLEQRTSKVLPFLVLAPDLLAKMGVRVDLAQVREAVNGYLRIIPEFLAGDGGLAYYRGSSWSSDYLTIYVLWALQLARQADYAVDGQIVARLESHLKAKKLSPYCDAFRQLVLSMNGQADAGALRRLYADRLTLSLPARVFLYRALGFQFHDRERRERQKTMAAEFVNGLQVEADFAYFDVAEFSYDRDLPFYSSRYATALILQALLEWEADFPLAARVLNWLLEAPPYEWHTTQVNFWVLYAAAEYNQRIEKGGATRARIEWPGQDEEGRFASPQDTIVREKDLTRQREEFGLRVSGDQPLYLTTELNYRLLRPGALNRGINVRRLIYGEDGRLAEEFRQGSIYQVELLLDFDKEVPYAVVDEPLAAGFEVLRRDAASTRQLKEFNSVQAKAYATPWLRDEYQPDRIVFYSYGLGGKVRLTYFIKAIYAGRFTWLPTLVQGMYHPQYAGRTATGEVVINQPIAAEDQSR